MSGAGFEERVRGLMDERLREIRVKIDRIFAILMSVQWAGAVIVSLLVTPRTWEGPLSSVHVHVLVAVFIGGLLAVPPIVLARTRPGEVSTGYVVSISQALFSCLLIHISNGRIETHFHVFGSLAFIAFYRDWRLLVPATLVIGVDHLVRGIYFPESVFGLAYSAPWRVAEHTGWVMFEDLFVGYSCIVARRELWESCCDQVELRCAYEGVETTIRERTADLERTRRVVLEERALLANIVNNIPAQVFWKDRESRYLGCNAIFARLAGLSAPEMIVGRTDFDLPWSREQAEGFVRDDRDVMRSGEAKLELEETQLAADGHTRTLLTSKVPLKDGLGRLIGVLGIAADITERRQLEQQLSQAQKLESIGQLAAGIAHEINTPVQYVSDNVRFLKDQFRAVLAIVAAGRALSESGGDGSHQRALSEALCGLDYEFVSTEVPQAIDQSLEGLGRVATIVRAMKEFSHPDTRAKAPADLNQAIRSTAVVCTNRWKYVANLHLDLAEDLPQVPCLVAKFNQVILNLIVNAADAIGEQSRDRGAKGSITVRTRVVGDHAEIRVEDDGPGMPEAVQKRLFEPFFTTKGVGKGTGQGLAISRSVIEKKHGGTLRFESEPGRGTVFVIRMPLEAQRQEPLRAGKEAA